MRRSEPDEREEVCPGVHVECFPGHTRQMLTVWIESEGETACFVSDLLPTAAHLQPAWVMGFDLDPLRTIQEKRRMYARAVRDGALLLLPHDHAFPMGLLREEGDGFAWAPAVADAEAQ